MTLPPFPFKRRRWFIFGFLFLIPLLDSNAYHLDVLTTAWLYGILALGLNLIVGWAGLLNLGYAAFFAIGAYTYALLNLHAHIPFWVGLPLSALTAGVAGVVLGLPAIRVRGDYLAIVTLGFGEIVRIALTNLESWTGGPNGVLGIDSPHLAGFDFSVSSAPYYFLTLILMGLIWGALHRVTQSRIGRAWVAIREDELAAQCMGVDTVYLKLAAHGFGAAIGGVAGAVFAAKQGTVTPDSFDFIQSVMVLAMVVLGGLGNPTGAVAGAVVLTLLPELLREFSSYRMVLFGITLILVMRFRPQGL
ncbi:MAG: branched-chain amino acid ABC transporter permease, partial [Candidatus Omnitrophica bacterium]|nr:branched-chain amino acid ABC transporter permease [Candidatus Omnitrophota bacterium]